MTFLHPEFTKMISFYQTGWGPPYTSGSSLYWLFTGTVAVVMRKAKQIVGDRGLLYYTGPVNTRRRPVASMLTISWSPVPTYRPSSSVT